MRFDELNRIKLSVIEASDIYHDDQPRPEIHNWQIDWAALRQLILDNSEQLLEVKAGLAEDWLRTHGTVWEADRGFLHRPNDASDYDDTVFWGYSSWATPAIVVTFADETETAYALYQTGMDSDFHDLGMEIKK